MCILLRFSNANLDFPTHSDADVWTDYEHPPKKTPRCKKCIFLMTEWILCYIFTLHVPFSRKKALPPLFRGVAFQQGSVHRITKLLRGFQNMSKACWGLPKTAASGARLWEGLGLHQVEVCTAAASWCINAPHAKFTLSVLGLSIPGKQSLELLKLPIT